jgi:hypothetical protein
MTASFVKTIQAQSISSELILINKFRQSKSRSSKKFWWRTRYEIAQRPRLEICS